MRAASLALGLAACTNEASITNLCGGAADGFDITEASVLQDAFGVRGLHDAVILRVPDDAIPDGARWRVRVVEVLAMVPTDDFEDSTSGQELTVEVWDGDDPTTSTPFSRTEAFDKDDLTWEHVLLDNPTEATAAEQESAWWSFDLGDDIPSDGFQSDRYLVGVAFGGDLPVVGYSNYNRSCAQNWTEYPDDSLGWVLNGENSGNECSWPMLRVGLEILTERADDCESGTVAIE